MNELISVVVPIYNVEEYLSRCIESIINQSYVNLEIILINDGSTDSSLSICKKYLKKDNRIVLIDKKNGGLSDARNAGIKKSSGKYLFFIDSDDYIHKNCIELAYKLLSENNADISVLSYKNVYGTSTIDDDLISNLSVNVYGKNEALENLLYQKGCTTSAWGKLYKKELFSDIEYPVGKVHEDLPVTYKLFYLSNKVVISDAKMYYYLIRNTSITGSKYNIKRAISLDFAADETHFIKNNMSNLLLAAYNREFMEAVYTILAIGFSDGFNEVKRDAKKIVKKYRRFVLKDKKASKKSKLFAFTSYFGTSTLCFLCFSYLKIKRR